MTATQQGQMAPPMKITGLLQAQWANQVLKTALQLDVFTHLKNAALTPGQLAQKLNASQKGVKLLLNALAAMEMVRKSADTYDLTDVSRTYLVADSDLFMGRYIQNNDVIDQCWQQLAQTISSGQPFTRVDEQAIGEDFFVELTIGIFPMSYTTAQSLAKKLNMATHNTATNVLDLAAGSGVWTLPMAECNKNVTVDALDFPKILQVTETFATKFGVASQYRYLPGNWREVELKPEHYDYIVLGHILHCEGKEESLKLLKHCAKAMKMGGTIVIGEFFENEERTGPIFPSLFALNMMLATSEGCVFTPKELMGMLEDCGFHDPQRVELPVWGTESPVMIARK